MNPSKPFSTHLIGGGALDAAVETGRNPVSKHQILSVENEQADATVLPGTVFSNDFRVRQEYGSTYLCWLKGNTFKMIILYKNAVCVCSSH